MEAMNDGIMPVDQGTIYRHSMQQDSPGRWRDIFFFVRFVETCRNAPYIQDLELLAWAVLGMVGS